MSQWGAQMILPDLIEIKNGTPAKGTFSDAEYERRLSQLRAIMHANGIDTVLFTSYHNICYYADFLYCAFGRSYGLVVDGGHAVSISANIDGGQPWRHTYGNQNLVYTDWQRGNYFRAVRSLVTDGDVIGTEFDSVTLDTKAQLVKTFPNSRFVDIAPLAMGARMIKSDEEIAHITAMARIADLGGEACVEAMAPGVAEYEVAEHARTAMVREIARVWPDSQLMDTWVWLQSGINTDGAHNPLTTRRLAKGDIVSLNTFPMVCGYYIALERTLFCGPPGDAHRRYWEINCEVHAIGTAMLKPGLRCKEIAGALNEIYQAYNLLDRRTFGYGHSFGVLSHYYGREAKLELREDVDTVLEPGMVISMEPMIMIPEGEPGAGGYREHDVLIITEGGARNITGFPYGPEHNILDF